ncbi:MAG: DUF3883 domain-containing protein [Myxococcales bacterium]|nr:DUF3883 domain-containing protein [Myxococcales bacterium]
MADGLLEKIRNENLNVYRASPQRLREDVGQESQIAQDYRGRLVYELLQNADDAMASASGSSCIRFELTDNDLWVSNSGRALDESDVRGLCGISASKKSVPGEKRRASIGHKGMGFKSVLEITDAPEVFSTTVSFRFSPEAAVRGVQPLVGEGKLEEVSRAPATRFPWPANQDATEWDRLRLRGMNTAFRFPLRDRMTGEQRDRLATVLRELPVTSLVFLKHIGRIEVDIRRSSETRSFAWSVHRQHAIGDTWTDVAGFDESGDYRVTLVPDEGAAEMFLLAYDADIAIGDHRGGLDEFTWEGVEFTEVSVAARMNGDQPAAIRDEWRRFHVFLPTGEPCPYDLLVSGAFGSNLSRQEIRVEEDSTNYNRFLFGQAARVLRDRLLPKLLAGGATVVGCLSLLDRRVEPCSRCATPAAQALYESVVETLADLAFLPAANDSQLAIRNCAVPPIVADDDVGRSFRSLLRPDASCGGRALPRTDLCGAFIGRVLVDHGAYAIAPDEAAALLALAEPSRSELVVHASDKVFVDPVLSVLEQLWRGLGWQDKALLVAAARREPLFPVAIESNTSKRISTQDATCFYPPRFLHGEVPLEGLCFLLQELCWGDLTPKERNIELQHQMEGWKALFDIREFKFPEVMRASVLPALDLERDTDDRSERTTLQDLDRLAAICQLAGRTPNENAPLPYERLKTNRALFNLSRLDVPCRGASDGDVKWIPAYKAYFGSDWLGAGSVEGILKVGRELDLTGLPAVDFVLGPDRFAGLLERYRHLKGEEEGDQGGGDVGEDEVSIDEDEEVALDADDRERWLRFFQWVGVNASLRPVHFHDVEDRASGWLKTHNLRRPEGRAFQNVPGDLWTEYRQAVLAALVEKDPELAASTVPYFYELHDLEHLVAFSNIAAAEPTARFARVLYEHLARHWSTLEKVSRVVVAQVPATHEPARRTKPPRAKADELTDGGMNLWLFRLQDAAVCPTGHGPRGAAHTWLPTPEVQRRFGRRARAGTFLIPTLDVDAAVLKGKPRAFAQALGVRDELSPATFTVADARVLLDRLRELYQAKCDADEDLRLDLREVIRPAYRNLMELLSGKADDGDSSAPLSTAMVLTSDGHGPLRFFDAQKVFYLDRRDTRERLVTDSPIWTFVIESSPAARIVLTQMFRMRVLEDSLTWSPKPGDQAFVDDRLAEFRGGLRRLAPYVLARVGADRADEGLARQDARKLRDFIDAVEPVTALDLTCRLDGNEIAVGDGSREAFVDLGGGDQVQAFVVWGENPWPPDQREAETLAGALCDVLGAGYFESFIALLQSESPALRLRILRRAGAPLDVEDKRVLFQSANDGDGEQDEAASGDADAGDEPKTAAAPTGAKEDPAAGPAAFDRSSDGATDRPRVPLYDPSDLVIEGVPLIIVGDPAGDSQGGKGTPSGSTKPGSGKGNGRFGGNTDLEKLDALGMWVALSFEQGRLRRAGLPEARVFDSESATVENQGLVFNVSKPELVESARRKSTAFDAAMTWLHEKFGVVPDWPGFDILTLDPRAPDSVDRMIELKSSGVASRIQEMTWNEWKTATASILRERFYLYLVGNLRADLAAAQPYIRTIRNPFEQMVADVQIARSIQKKVQLAVHEFREAEHLDLTVQRLVPDGGTK